MIDVGSVCVKLVGKEKGKYCVVVKRIDKNFVLISGPKFLTGVKRRRVNVIHLQPTQYKLEIKEDASDEELYQAWEKSGLIEKFGLKRPTTIPKQKVEEKKVEEKKKEKKEEKAKAKKEKKEEKKKK